MNRLTGCLLLSVFLLLTPCIFAQEADQSSSGSGVLVSGSSDAPELSDEGNPNSSGHQGHEHGDEDVSSQNRGENSDNNANASSSPTDEVIVKSTDAMMFQMTANLKLTQDQISAIRPIVTDNIIKVRDLQLSLQNGNIDSKMMYSQRQQLLVEENKELSHILTVDQMKMWIGIENE